MGHYRQRVLAASILLTVAPFDHQPEASSLLVANTLQKEASCGPSLAGEVFGDLFGV